MVQKRSKKIDKKSFYLYIITTIKNSNKLPTNVSKQRLNYYVRTLKINNIIIKKGYGTWEVTKFGEEYINQKEVKKCNLYTFVQPTPFRVKKSKPKTWKRTHGLRWKIQTPASYSRLPIFKILESKNLNPVVTGNKTIKILLYGHIVHFCQKSIIVWFDKDFYFKSKTANQGFKLAVHEIKRLITRFESLLTSSIRIRKLYKFKCSFKHFGDVGNEIAKYFNSKNKYIRVFDKGREWLLMDFSDKAFVELETTDNAENIIDMDQVITPFMNKLRRDPKILNRLDETDHKIMEMLENQQRVSLEVMKMQEQQQRTIKYLLDRSEKSINLERFTN